MTDSADRVRQIESRIAELERVVESRRRFRMPRLRGFRRMFIVGVSIALALPAGVVLAAHQFTDVPNSHTFHADIARIDGAGITAGCTASTFCPESSLTRGQMAGFLSRGLGRAATDNRSITFAQMLDGTPLAEVSIKTGGVSGGTGFLLVTASAEIQASDGVCPCDVGIVVARGASDFSPVSTAIARTQINSGWWVGDATVTWVFEAPSGTNQTLQVRANGISWVGGSDNSFAKAMITALYIPFGPTGGNTLEAQGSSVVAPSVFAP